LLAPLQRLVQMDAHPAALGKDMVGHSPPAGHQFISDDFRKGNVDEMVAVHMTDFPPPKAIIRSSEAARLGLFFPAAPKPLGAGP